MSKTSKRPARHANDHIGSWDPANGALSGGYDPLPLDVFLAPSGVMGSVVGGGRIIDLGFGINNGVLYLPEREGPQLTAGEAIRASYAFAEPSPGHFEWLGMRVHVVSGIKASRYRHIEPWNSDPWFGGAGTSGTAGTLSIFPLDGNWDGYFYGISAVSASETDIVTFSSPGGEINAAQKYTWSVSGGGHISYIFYDFRTSQSGNITASFADGAGYEKTLSYVRCRRGTAGPLGSVAVGDMVGENEVAAPSGSAKITVSLTDDVPAGHGLIVVTGSQGRGGFNPSDATTRPVIENASREPPGNLIPAYKVGGQLYPIARDIGGLGQAGGPISGGSPAISRLIQVRHGTAAEWTALNPVLAAGELGAETDTGKLKVGNGSTAWSGLGYVGAGLDGGSP